MDASHAKWLRSVLGLHTGYLVVALILIIIITIIIMSIIITIIIMSIMITIIFVITVLSS